MINYHHCYPSVYSGSRARCPFLSVFPTFFLHRAWFSASCVVRPLAHIYWDLYDFKLPLLGQPGNMANFDRFLMNIWCSSVATQKYAAAYYIGIRISINFVFGISTNKYDIIGNIRKVIFCTDPNCIFFIEHIKLTTSKWVTSKEQLPLTAKTKP